jgi:hypothetical protein
MNPPILFIHYGDSYYLSHTLRAARRSNPGTRIVLLGDAANRKYRRFGIEHRLLEAYSGGHDLATFEQVYRPIQGPRHHYNKARGMDYWTKFVFRRWFLIRKFLEAEDIGAFWTFDSDTLILAPLDVRVARFSHLDCTEQCQGCCMNGYISGPNIVRRYVQTMNKLFLDEKHLAHYEKYFREVAPAAAYTEMTAYMTFRKLEAIHTIRLSSPVDGEVFDDALAFTDGYIISSYQIGLRRMKIKRLMLGPDTSVWGSLAPAGTPVRFVTINLSWMPAFVGRILAGYASPNPKLQIFSPDTGNEIVMQETATDRLRPALGQFFSACLNKLFVKRGSGDLPSP